MRAGRRVCFGEGPDVRRAVAIDRAPRFEFACREAEHVGERSEWLVGLVARESEGISPERAARADPVAELRRGVAAQVRAGDVDDLVAREFSLGELRLAENVHGHVRVGEREVNPLRILERRAADARGAPPNFRRARRDKRDLGRAGRARAKEPLLAATEETRGARDAFEQFGRLREAVALRVIGAVSVPLDHPRAARDDGEHPLLGRAAMGLHETAHRHRVTIRDAAADVGEIGFPLPHARVAIRGFKNERCVRVVIVELVPVETRTAPTRRRPLHRVQRNARLLEVARGLGKNLRGRVGHEAKRVVITQRVEAIFGQRRWAVAAGGFAFCGSRGRGLGDRQCWWKRDRVGGFRGQGFF